MMYTLYAIFTVCAVLVTFVLYFIRRTREDKIVNEYIEKKEQQTVKTTVSKFDTNSIAVSIDDNELYGVHLTTRVRTYVEDNTVMFTLRSTNVREHCNINIALSRSKFPINDVYSQQQMPVHLIEIRRVGKESDNLLSFIANLWGVSLKQKGRLRMKDNVMGYASSIAGDTVNFADEIHFQLNLGVEKLGQVDPCLFCRIDWKNGTASLEEIDSLYRPIIINRLRY